MTPHCVLPVRKVHFHASRGCESQSAGGSAGGVRVCASFGACEAGPFAVPEGKRLSVAERSDKDENKAE